MTQGSKDIASRWAELLTKVGLPTALLVAVLYYVRVDWILPANEERREMTKQLSDAAKQAADTNKSLASSYEKMAHAMDAQTELMRSLTKQ